MIIAQQREMGMAAATNLTQSIIYHFKPLYIIMVGIAAGIGNGKNLGDIIAATEVWNYSSGKYITDENGKLAFSPDPTIQSTGVMNGNILWKFRKGSLLRCLNTVDYNFQKK